MSLHIHSQKIHKKVFANVSISEQTVEPAEIRRNLCFSQISYFTEIVNYKSFIRIINGLFKNTFLIVSVFLTFELLLELCKLLNIYVSNFGFLSENLKAIWFDFSCDHISRFFRISRKVQIYLSKFVFRNWFFINQFLMILINLGMAIEYLF